MGEGRWASNGSTLRHVLQQVARLAVELSAQGLERRESDGLDPTGLELAQVRLRDADPLGQVRPPELSERHHHVQAHDDRHLDDLPQLTDERRDRIEGHRSASRQKGEKKVDDGARRGLQGARHHVPAHVP